MTKAVAGAVIIAGILLIASTSLGVELWNKCNDDMDLEDDDTEKQKKNAQIGMMVTGIVCILCGFWGFYAAMKGGSNGGGAQTTGNTRRAMMGQLGRGFDRMMGGRMPMY